MVKGIRGLYAATFKEKGKTYIAANHGRPFLFGSKKDANKAERILGLRHTKKGTRKMFETLSIGYGKIVR